MPQIPFYKTTISTDVIRDSAPAERSVAQAGIVGNSMASLGNALQDVSLGVLDEVKRAEAISAVSTLTQQRLFDNQDYKAKLLESSHDGYVYEDTPNGRRPKLNPDKTQRTITQEYRDWANQQYESDQRNLPSRMAQELYQKSMGDHYTENMVLINNDFLKKQLSSVESSFKEQDVRLLNRLTDSPSTEMLYASVDDARKTVGSLSAGMDARGRPYGILSAKKQTEIINARDDNATRGWFEGVYTRAKEAPTIAEQIKIATDGLNKLRGIYADKNGNIIDKELAFRKQNGKPTLDELIQHGQKGEMERKLVALKDVVEANATSHININQIFEDELAAARRGDAPSPYLHQMITTKMGTLKDDDKRKALSETATQMSFQIIAASEARKLGVEMRTQPSGQWKETMERFGQNLDLAIQKAATKNPSLSVALHSNFGASARETEQRVLNTAPEKIQKEQKDDAFSYVKNEYKSIGAKLAVAAQDPRILNQTLDSVFRKYDELAIPVEWRRVMDKETSARIGRDLQSKDRVEQALEHYSRLYGDKWGMAMEQMTKDGSISKDNENGLAAALQIQPGPARHDAIMSAVNSSAIHDAYKISVPDEKERNAHAAALSAGMASFMNGVNSSQDGNTADFSNSIYKLVQTEQLKLIPHFKDTKTKEEIVDMAKKRILEQWSVLEVSGREYPVPKSDGATVIDPRIVETFMISHKTPEALSAMNIDVPTSILGRPDFNAADAATKKSMWIKTVVERGFWKPDPHNFGVMLQVEDANGRLVQVTQKGGSRLQMKYRDIVKNMDEFTRKALAPSALQRTGDQLLNFGADLMNKGADGLNRAQEAIRRDKTPPLPFNGKQ